MRQILAIPILLAACLLAVIPLVLGTVWVIAGDYKRGPIAWVLFGSAVFLISRLMKALKRWQAHEKLTANRVFVQRFIALPILMFAFMAFIYPGASLLTQWSGFNSGDPIAYCTAFPPRIVGVVLLCELAALLGWALLFRWRNDAVLALLDAVPFGLLLGTWFAAAGLGITLCQPLPQREAIYPVLHAALLPLAIYSMVWLHMRLARTIKFNPRVYDFERMQFALFTPVERPDGQVVRPAHYVYVAAFFGGAALLLGYVLSRKVPAGFVGDWLGVILSTTLAYAFLILAVSGISNAWHIARRCHGRKMTIKEFSYNRR